MKEYAVYNIETGTLTGVYSSFDGAKKSAERLNKRLKRYLYSALPYNEFLMCYPTAKAKAKT
jgi:hypothetical protein